MALDLSAPGVGQGFVLTGPPPGTWERMLSPSFLISFHLSSLRIQNRRKEEPLCIKSHGRGKLYVALSFWKGFLGFQNTIIFQDSILRDLL